MAGKVNENLQKLVKTFSKMHHAFVQYLAKSCGVVDDFNQTLADYVITKSPTMLPSFLLCGDGLFRLFYYDVEAEKFKARIVKKSAFLGQEYELSEAIYFRKRSDFLLFLNGTCKLNSMVENGDKDTIKKGYNWVVESLSHPVNAYEICKPNDKRIMWIDEHRNIFINTFKCPEKVKEYRRYRLAQKSGRKDPQARLKWGEKFPFIAGVIDNVLGAKDDPKARDKFLHDLAYHMETFTPCFNLWLLLDKQGTGKGVLTSQILMRLYSEADNYTSVARLTGAEFTAKWGDAFINRLFLDIDEVEERTGKEGLTINQRVKTIVANARYAVQLKFRDTQQVDNHAFVVMSSNERMPFKIDPGINRRYNIVRGSGVPLTDLFPQIRSNLNDWLNTTIEAELSPFLQYLAQIPLDFQTYSTCVETEYKAFVIDNSTGDAQKVAELLLGQRGLDQTREFMSELACDYVEHLIQNKIKQVASSDLRKLFPQDFKELTSVLKFYGASAKAVRIKWLLDEGLRLYQLPDSKILNGYAVSPKV
ncbi:primase-helicase family protein [Helicobacter ailurogastricus]|uniref:primase-helicase family protein n=1 Tax=Helicobacter ailurogastricus TaxID=1578720 RepID=UPI001315A1EE|nr:primase-helicase family protein [Helicobacter ailurogastricus]